MLRVVPLSDADLGTRALTATQLPAHSEFVRGWQDVTPPSPTGSSTWPPDVA
ncbi:hypothetical protein GCM10007390_51630 [Persicitalea jodogahamensis]|uniref:Uncharacterized protein n=1 Tax=Persicitalea jodogahamensis TaxID=402147 RepID=A0A8J3GCH5_9BACT|nr:hypothetical protein GCM10007390_51630 [Persicitalea jodogahamensis]